jgi:hypothetical protein
VLISSDVTTMPTAHLSLGHTSPGVLLVRPGTALRELFFAIALAARAGHPADYANQIDYFP